jgi:hypothetical protein
MMQRAQQLLGRLEAIAQAVKETGQGVAVLGLGSVGQELERLDEYSDLDFFVIAKPGKKPIPLTKIAVSSSVIKNWRRSSLISFQVMIRAPKLPRLC